MSTAITLQGSVAAPFAVDEFPQLRPRVVLEWERVIRVSDAQVGHLVTGLRRLLQHQTQTFFDDGTQRLAGRSSVSIRNRWS